MRITQFIAAAMTAAMVWLAPTMSHAECFAMLVFEGPPGHVHTKLSWPKMAEKEAGQQAEVMADVIEAAWKIHHSGSLRFAYRWLECGESGRQRAKKPAPPGFVPFPMTFQDALDVAITKAKRPPAFEREYVGRRWKKNFRKDKLPVWRCHYQRAYRVYGDDGQLGPYGPIVYLYQNNVRGGQTYAGSQMERAVTHRAEDKAAGKRLHFESPAGACWDTTHDQPKDPPLGWIHRHTWLIPADKLLTPTP